MNTPRVARGHVSVEFVLRIIILCGLVRAGSLAQKSGQNARVVVVVFPRRSGVGAADFSALGERRAAALR
eukprot:3071913-Prymnesium_polylepis.1